MLNNKTVEVNLFHHVDWWVGYDIRCIWRGACNLYYLVKAAYKDMSIEKIKLRRFCRLSIHFSKRKLKNNLHAAFWHWISRKKNTVRSILHCSKSLPVLVSNERAVILRSRISGKNYLVKAFYKKQKLFLPASPKAKAGLGVGSLRPSVRPSVPKSCHRSSSETTDPIIMKLGMYIGHYM